MIITIDNCVRMNKKTELAVNFTANLIYQVVAKVLVYLVIVQLKISN